jgi:hypothetical protein
LSSMISSWQPILLIRSLSTKENPELNVKLTLLKDWLMVWTSSWTCLVLPSAETPPTSVLVSISWTPSSIRNKRLPATISALRTDLYNVWLNSNYLI